MEVLKLMQSRNRCLVKFQECTLAFLKEAQAGNFSQIESFQKNRDYLIKAFQLYDRKLTSVIELLPRGYRTPLLLQEVSNENARSEYLIKNIFKLDQEVITLINEEKSKLQNELFESDRNHNQVNKFKSHWVSEAGEILDGKI
jgi:hypothetical protein